VPVVRAPLPVHSIAAPADRAAARSRLGLPAGAAVALFFGFVRPYKGLEGLIDALPAVAARVPALQLVVAGEFWQPAGAFLSRAAALGVAGRLRLDDRYVPNEEVGDYFAAADVVVMPYRSATQSGVVTLAAEFGRPVVATRVGGLPEAVEHGVGGLLVPPGDVPALAEALAAVLSDAALRERLSAGSRAGISRFDWSQLVAAVERLADR
jgi:glycosyltransferase involved in cell wall biosynthesis